MLTEKEKRDTYIFLHFCLCKINIPNLELLLGQGLPQGKDDDAGNDGHWRDRRCGRGDDGGNAHDGRRGISRRWLWLAG